MFIACTFLTVMLASCEGCEDEDIIPPATETTPTTVLYLNYGQHEWYDTLSGREDKCKFFDGVMNKAAQVVVRILVPDPTSAAKMRDLYPAQVKTRYPDFPSGDPNGLGFNVPQTGGYAMLIQIYGEIDTDCCPGPPPGRPYFEGFWPYDDTENGFRLRHIIPEYRYCIFI